MEIVPFEKNRRVPGISLIGKLCTLNDYQLLRNQFNNITIEGSYAIIDLTRLTFTSSDGLGIFFNIARRLKAIKKDLILFNPRKEVKSVLLITGIDKRIKIIYTNNELLRWIKE